jgi:enoyl-CoA hydratase/carnithine racemase
MSDGAPAVETQVDGNVAVIRLNRPGTFNALSTELITGIGEALRSFEAESTVRVVLLEAEGENFCTGANLKEAKKKREALDDWREFIANGLKVFRSLEQSPLPVVAAVQGLCLAGGLELVLCCDVVFAAQSARLGDQHARFGLLPGWGGSQRLPRILGLRRALDLFFSARWVGADEAKAMGLINYVVKDAELHQRAREHCRTMANGCPRSLALMRRLARDGIEKGLEEGLLMEQEQVVTYMLSDDASEGLAAFEEGRKPCFR